MNNKQRRHFERLNASTSFGDSHADDFPPTSKGGQALANLHALLEQASTHDAARVTNQRTRQQATGSRSAGREDLRAQIAAIVDTAGIIGRDHAEVKGAFARPRTNSNDQTLLSVARSFAAAAAPLKARFIEYDLPAGFLTKFNASIDSFDAAINQQTTGTNARVAANASLEDTLDRAQAEFERFDTAVRNKFREDPATLAAWESASRIEQAPKSKKPATKTAKKTIEAGAS